MENKQNILTEHKSQEIEFSHSRKQRTCSMSAAHGLLSTTPSRNVAVCQTDTSSSNNNSFFFSLQVQEWQSEYRTLQKHNHPKLRDREIFNCLKFYQEVRFSVCMLSRRTKTMAFVVAIHSSLWHRKVSRLAVVRPRHEIIIKKWNQKRLIVYGHSIVVLVLA